MAEDLAGIRGIQPISGGISAICFKLLAYNKE
jgi:hypothetical protein